MEGCSGTLNCVSTFGFFKAVELLLPGSHKFLLQNAPMLHYCKALLVERMEASTHWNNALSRTSHEGK